MMNDPAGAACATDAVCYLYLARVAERLGHPKAAGRWYEKADRWLEAISPRQSPTGAVVSSLPTNHHYPCLLARQVDQFEELRNQANIAPRPLPPRAAGESVSSPRPAQPALRGETEMKKRPVRP